MSGFRKLNRFIGWCFVDGFHGRELGFPRRPRDVSQLNIVEFQKGCGFNERIFGHRHTMCQDCVQRWNHILQRSGRFNKRCFTRHQKRVVWKWVGNVHWTLVQIIADKRHDVLCSFHRHLHDINGLVFMMLCSNHGILGQHTPFAFTVGRHKGSGCFDSIGGTGCSISIGSR